MTEHLMRDRFHDLAHGGFLDPAFARKFCFQR